jgi:hypothetical protein
MKVSFSILGLLISSLTLCMANAAPEAVVRKHEIHLNDFYGKTFLDAMVESHHGIKMHLDADYTENYPMADWTTVQLYLSHFDSKNVRKILGSFENGEEGLKELVQSLQGTVTSPSQMVSALRGKIKSSGDIFAVAQFLSMASGAGTLVVLDSDNYYYNYGYKSGSVPNEDVKSGRSFGAGPLHNAIDASDVYYLNELEKYLQSTPDLKPFYTAILKVLLKCDSSGLRELSPLGQTVATDFLAIYTAEVDRHLMVDLKPQIHPWENDLAGSTFVSAFGARVGKVMKEGVLQAAPARDWWAMSASGSGRSGIGITRKDRQKLQQHLSAYLRATRPELVAQIENAIPQRTDGDLFQGLMEFVNTSVNQGQVAQNADVLIETYSELLNHLQGNASAIETQLLQ